jgi:hypothetical protein
MTNEGRTVFIGLLVLLGVPFAGAWLWRWIARQLRRDREYE